MIEVHGSISSKKFLLQNVLTSMHYSKHENGWLVKKPEYNERTIARNNYLNASRQDLFRIKDVRPRVGAKMKRQWEEGREDVQHFKKKERERIGRRCPNHTTVKIVTTNHQIHP